MSSPVAAAPIDALYREHRAWLLGWLRRRLGDEHVAADLAQDTFVRVITGGQAPVLQEPRAYLTTLAQRLLCNFWRRRELERAWLDTLAAQPEELAPSPETYALVREAIETLDRWLDGLPPKVRQAFLLRRLEGLAHGEIAARMGVSVTTVERYVKQAIVHLYTCPAG
ncbi:sigma-70 family RNA polymerase sigma factor [Xylophilus sp. ASV27]|uniref:sigma-70 family RNA polymerase sigma factor n=1 Tax=Xylophilus sp. ASV27 TaxID=2795129 RepID=UPI0018EE406E|nr:sigma-70 family RNA polymerase sigma factor [Xylophilus sp. ASV27]